MKVLVKNQLIERDEAKVDVEDRGYQFGDGVYEVIRMYNGQFFTYDEHIERLYASAAKIDLVIPYSKPELRALVDSLMEANNIGTGNVYLQITRGEQSPRNHVIPSTPPEAVLTASASEVPRDTTLFENGRKAILEEDVRWLRCDIKSLNLLGNSIAKNKAHQAGAFEAILHRGENVTEGSAANAYMIKDGKLITHASNNLILEGITRQVILRVAEENGIPVVESGFTLTDLAAADEVFISSTTIEVTPIIEIDGKVVGDGKRGPITKKLHDAFTKEIMKQCGELAVN
ncbi:D-amino-acid transaminase [Listeria newyorkensis]|uniref:D-alanine aminotransferase n=1 Tax=Listeria newyorkensis TaxID=1497681 RepID=A0ABX4XLV4_9LIST|nr:MULTISPECIES: D-amino-acid transaminase [Listeria]KGL38634.1 D-alanine aminotransferase [Listeriaceae bacterium FSL A5-0209]KGL46620.1 D-alanine aminotransferase [Listeria newyorkensis]KMT59030.1 D-amino acid aminotransferase [Listeria newyorkensis]PNP91038.1 D-amino-acid transaminase [Listeria newyorkensis]RQW67874.1 D-amino-acid transaminase [Listeria sp. SHR_NRA_18]